VRIADIRDSEFARLARGRKDMGASFLGVPISLGKAVLGVMNLAARPAAGPFDETNLMRAGIVAMLIGKAIQVNRLQTLLRSRVAQLTLARQEPEVAVSLTDGALPPARLAKVLAKAFYKDLAAAGFEAGQIIEAATEIIGQISGDIARHKTRLARAGRQEKD
jgi:signal transduction protein with GAF and PtsI domain